MLSLSKSGGPRNNQEEGSGGNCKDRRQRRQEGQSYRSRMSLNFLIEQRQEITLRGQVCLYIQPPDSFLFWKNPYCVDSGGRRPLLLTIRT